MSAEPRTIGIIVAPHGLQGTVKVDLLSDFPERFLKLKSCLVRRPGEAPQQCNIRRVKLTTSQALITFEFCRTRDQAEELRGVEVCVPDESSWPLPENTYYITDLVGFSVLGDDATELGSLVDVIRGAQDLLHVDGPHGELLVPFVDAWVGEIDSDHRTIVVLNWRALIEAEDA